MTEEKNGEMTYGMWLPKEGNFSSFEKGKSPIAIGTQVNIIPMIKEMIYNKNKMEPIQTKIEPTQDPSANYINLQMKLTE